MGIFSKKKDNLVSMKIVEEGLTYHRNDKKKAFETMMKAAEMKNEIAEFYIARMYETGIGTEKNIDEAVSWYADSVDDGCYVSSLYLARIYVKGYDPEYDEEKTVGLLGELFNADSIDALEKAPDVLYETALLLCTGKASFDGTNIGTSTHAKRFGSRHSKMHRLS